MTTLVTHFWKDGVLWHATYQLIPRGDFTEFHKVHGTEAKCECRHMELVRIQGARRVPA